MLKLNDICDFINNSLYLEAISLSLLRYTIPDISELRTQLNTDLIMGKALWALLIICLLFPDPNCHAQSIQVSDPRLELRDNTIHITYDILNSDPSDEFTIDLSITDANGNRINAAALSGDIGVEQMKAVS